MGLGPHGDGRAGPPRRAGPMMTAMLFGSLIVGGWRGGPPSALAGPPRLWRRPAGLRGDVCGDARTRRAALGRVSDGVCFTGQQSRWASPLPLGLRSSPSRGHCEMASYGDKLNGIPPEKAVDAVAYALAKCQATTFWQLRDSGKYHTEFVPAFMARLGIEDVVKVPARSTLDLVYQSHLAKKEVARIQVESETYKNKKAESDEEESRGSDDDEESDDYVGLDDDDDDDDGPPASVSVAPLSERPQRGVPQSEDQLRAEKMVQVRAALQKAVSALEKPSLGKNKTQDALGALGLRGDGVLGGSFPFDDKTYAMKLAKVACPDVVFTPEKIADARTVWRMLILYHHNLGDDELEKQIAAMRERCQ